MVEPLIVSGPRKLVIAPPSASLVGSDRPEAEPTRLSLTLVLASVSVPQLSIPPPPANANGHLSPPGQSASPGTVSVGATRFPLMTLFAIVTVAPPLKSAFGGISTPPPAAKTPSCPVNGVDSGLERVTPPVIVTPSIETVGSSEAPNSPIVSTGPPPLMIVWPAPAPTSLTLTSIVTPPANVPGSTAMVSPPCAASTAAWIVARAPGPLPTQSFPGAAFGEAAAGRWPANPGAPPSALAIATVSASELVSRNRRRGNMTPPLSRLIGGTPRRPGALRFGA